MFVNKFNCGHDFVRYYKLICQNAGYGTGKGLNVMRDGIPRDKIFTTKRDRYGYGIFFWCGIRDNGIVRDKIFSAGW